MSNEINNTAAITKIAFDAVDKNKDGHISYDELEACMKSVAQRLGMPEPPKDAILQTMGALDRNKDGKISLEEFSVLVIDLLTIITETDA